jgi:TolB-like protein/DNA-binding winged helix-turn-helix (wHTH) protein/Tfp pilus assembly protein PilF
MESGHPARGTIRFGVFEVDLRAGELRKQGLKIKLQKQPFQLLQMLLEHPGEVVSREDLQRGIWPADTFVDFDQGLSNAIKRLREALCDSAETPRYIETIPRRGYRFIGMTGSSTPGRMRSLAVLPLDNLSRDPQQEYFAEGLTEALITILAKIGELRVVSRTSAMQYKGVHKPLREIARELEVDAIVEGTVLRSGHRVRITAQLIDASREAHMWAESYERNLRDVLALQSELAQAIAREIQIKLTPKEKAHFQKVRPVDPEAYENYLRGRYHWNRRSGDALKKALACFQRAIDKDPTYGPAYAGLADCAVISGFWGYSFPAEGCGRAKVAARKALEIEDTAEAHASLGWATLHYDFDSAAAEKEFQRAIELNPSYATAHQWYAYCLACMGRLEMSLAEATRALELDPLSLMINTTYAGPFWAMRQWDRAIDHCQKALELDPTFVPLRWILAHVYQGKGMHEEAIRERQRALEISGSAPIFVAELGASYAAAGKREEALQIVEQLQELSKQCYIMSYLMALIYTGLKEKDEAFRWLEKAYQEHSPQLALVTVDPRIDYLRSDPRFQDLLRRMNFPQ